MIRKKSDQRRVQNIFVSYAHADLAYAQKLSSLISSASGARVFTTEQLKPGDNWLSALRKEIEQADIMVAIVSPNFVASQWAMHEIGAAWGLKKPIVAVVTQPGALSQIPIGLDASQTLVFKAQDVHMPARAERFVRDFEQILDRIETLHAA